jgi:hypothetical protein
MEEGERMRSAPSLSTVSRSQGSQASLYALNAAESAAHNRPSVTGQTGVWLVHQESQDCCEVLGTLRRMSSL